ncbi:MAG: protein kinase [Myxococcales bacterium]|nr:protein kinase [Myxococcales bacterium]
MVHENEATLGATSLPVSVRAPSLSVVDVEIPERYEIIRTLGQGGFGVVYLAHDRLLGQDVALKVLVTPDETLAARVRREVSALRLLRVPGVVGIIDDQPVAGGHLLVMEYIDGEAFPGARRDDFDTIRQRTVELLDTLSRVHGAGIVHRDLKPPNILVGRDGRVIVLDFGIAGGDAVEDRDLTRSGNFIGTFRYAAPEQLRGGPVDARADLYAVGCILREHVSGSSVYGEVSVAEAMRRRLTSELDPVRERVPSLPKVLAELIDRLLAREPAARPRNAGAALRLLGLARTTDKPPERPWFGRRDAVDELVSRLHCGESVRLSGQPGAGRTRTVQEAARVLESLGHDVVCLPRGARPLSSLRWWLDVPLNAASRLPEALQQMVSAVQPRLDRGAVIVVDGYGVDGTSLEVLNRVQGAVVSTVGGLRTPRALVRLPRVRRDDVASLFAGPERLLHRQSLSVARIWPMGCRYAGQVVSTLERAVEVGAATSEPDGTYSLTQSFEVTVTARTVSSRGSADLTTLGVAQRELVEWADAMAPHTTPVLAAESLGRPLWEVDADVLDLQRLGLVVVREGAIVCQVETDGTIGWSERRRRSVHATLGSALAEGTPDRLRYLIIGGDLSRALNEGLLIARRSLASGNGTECLAVARTVLAAAVGTRLPLAVASAYAEIVATAAAEEATIAACDVALYDLNRLENLSEGEVTLITRGIAFLRLCRRLWQSVDISILGDLDRLGPFAEEALELARQGARLRLARHADADTLAHVLAELSLLRSEASRSTAAAIDGIESLQAYREARWADAMRLSARSARGAATPARAARAWVSAGAAALEAFELDRALSSAKHAIVEARRAGHALHEGHAEWLARTALYRTERPLAVDHELIVASQQVGSPDLEAQICTTEAPIAFRNGELALAAKLARRVVTLWGPTGRGDEAALYEGLAWACDPESSSEVRSRLIEHACGSTVAGMGIQLLGLLRADVPADLRARQAAQVDRRWWSRRLDVLSVEESLARLGLAPSDVS